jgi:hypothetical protein
LDPIHDLVVVVGLAPRVPAHRADTEEAVEQLARCPVLASEADTDGESRAAGAEGRLADDHASDERSEVSSP